MASFPASGLLARLSRAIGRESAQHELRWMRQALQNPPKGIRPTAKTVEEMVERRARGEPLQYILGSQPFGPLHLAVRPPVLIPRPETEDWAINLVHILKERAPSQPLSILDLCTGTGCIPLLLSHELPSGSTHATGVDISDVAVELCRENARLNGIAVPTEGPPPGEDLSRWNENTFTPILADLMHPDFVQLARLKPPYDLITSNPPYIPMAAYQKLDASVKDFEDIRALLGDPDHSVAVAVPEGERNKGLSFYHRIAELVNDHNLLHPDGMLVLEVGDGQAGDVASILRRRTRLQKVHLWKDPWGKERVVLALS
ncbi:S-adenosyl-L-methionine-dependent methyltransferase [Trametes punicea]|nr:S-adenosyl-L-methionine-dependent methyltransferase [Trametes punicea]